jgi:hypothetical protein
MKVKVITFDAIDDPKSVFELTGIKDQHISMILYQADEGNKGTVFFGDRSYQPFTLSAGVSGQVPETDTKSFFLKADRVNDKIAIGLI